MKNHKPQSGQVLLIIVMLLTTVVIVLFSISFNAQTETKTTKLEQDQQRAFAAAESVLEAGLLKSAGSSYSISDLGLSSLSGFNGNATVTNTTGPVFITPLIQKDQAYTFYLSNYPGLGSPSNVNAYIYVDSENNCPAVELTYISETNNAVSHDLIDPCNKVNKNLSTALSTSGPVQQVLNNVSFEYKTSIQKPLSNMKLMVMHVLFADTKIGIENTSDLPPQGKITSAQAQTKDTNVSSSLQLFQSYPQIPADFLVTRF